MAFVFSFKSQAKLGQVHPDLQAVVVRALAISKVDFAVIEGLRTPERQRELFKQGKSKTMRSRHLTGHAVDLVPWVNGSLSWDWQHYYPLAEAVKQAAKELEIDVEWGGDWKTFKDGPHWQLSHAKYPA